ncbi:MAG: serine--tRNA ligase, partial [Anaerolineales bacterium]
MLDIKFIRENLDIVKAAAVKKKIKVDLDRLVTLDDTRRSLMSSIESKKAEQNRVSDEIAKASDASVREPLITAMQSVKAAVQAEEEQLKPVLEEWKALMLQVPNIPDMTVPDGESDADNVE